MNKTLIKTELHRLLSSYVDKESELYYDLFSKLENMMVALASGRGLLPQQPLASSEFAVDYELNTIDKRLQDSK